MDEITRGIVYTFYSFKGGVGRSMALANVAALLARWGHSVLIVDWDLEAPGLERYFTSDNASASQIGESKPGIVDLILAKADGSPIDWSDCVHEFEPALSAVPISLISAGRRDDEYMARVQNLNLSELFAQKDIGAYIDELRSAWLSRFKFILIDSRTGVTDIGGICTALLADVLVLVFTANDSSVEGAVEIINRAREARQHLPLDRGRLLAVPLPSKDETRTEYEKALEWKSIFAARFSFLYQDWLSGQSVMEAIETIRIPYVPYWSFGERLPVVEEHSTDPGTLSYSYGLLARLLASRLDWVAAFKENSLVPAPRATNRTISDGWIASHREKALEGLKSVHKSAYMEVIHYCVDSPIDKPVDRLRDAARQSMIDTLGWPIGVVLDRDDAKPRPKADQILAEIRSPGFLRGEIYDYWALTENGDFYTLMSLYEDDRDETAINVQSRVYKTVEALLHCVKLYRLLDADLKATIDFSIRYGGLRGRTLRSSDSTTVKLPAKARSSFEDGLNTHIQFRIDRVESNLAESIERLCRPLFLLFDFTKVDKSTYERLVSNFQAKRVG